MSKVKDKIVREGKGKDIVEQVRILIVDDRPENLLVMRAILKEEDYKIDTALSGSEALKKVLQKKYSLILLDVQMPDMDGFEVAEILSDIEATKEIPIIFLTGLSKEKQYVMKGYSTGGVDYMSKPIDPDILKVKALTFLKLYHQQQVLQNALKALDQTTSDLEKHTRNITDSIKYAKKIQEGVLPREEVIKAVFPESFIFFRPLDIVGGDFYWLNVKNGCAVLTAGDCTGHGVPGALMSMIGNNLLNHAVMEGNLIRPEMILSEMNKQLKQTFNHNSQGHELPDGMEISICAYDMNNSILHFSGAGRPLLLVQNGKQTLIKGNYYGIGNGTPLNHTFQTHTFEVNKGDSIYLFSDGFVDQFGGEHNRKIMSSGFRDLIDKIHVFSMQEQHKLLQDYFDNWKGDYFQVDDTLVMGVRF